MAKQTYTVGQTLTAAQMTSLQANDYNWTVSAKTANYVLVATDAGTTITMNSASATTITVNTSLFTAGDTLRIQNIGAGACVVTAGTATVTSAGSLSIPQWGGGTLYFTSASASVYFPNAATSASGLTLVKTQTIGSAVATVEVTDAFSATYENYLITVSGGASSASTNMRMILGATTAGYYQSFVNAPYDGSATTVVATNNGAIWTYSGYTTANGINMAISLQSPQLAKQTYISAPYNNGTTTAGVGSGQSNGFLNNTTQYTAFTISPASGTLTGGTIRVYGYANS